MRKLTDKQLAFCEEYVANGYNGSGAYGEAYDKADNANMCSVEAWKMLRQPRIIEQIKRIEGCYKIIGMEQGVDKKFVMGKVKDMMNATKQVFHSGKLISETPDYNAINNAVQTWTKLTGEFEAEKKQVEITDTSEVTRDPSKMSNEEIKEYKAKILKDL